MNAISRLIARKPAAPGPLGACVGQYGSAARYIDVAEEDGSLLVFIEDMAPVLLRRLDETRFDGADIALNFSGQGGQETSVELNGQILSRWDPGEELTRTFQDSLAQWGTPHAPAVLDRPEWVSTSSSELVPVAALDAGIRVDVKYAGFDNFMGRPVYDRPLAILARAPAGALLDVQKSLEPVGYSLLVYDAYRPWSITKLFWDLASPDTRPFLADPQNGSIHNRGCAVDVTLWSEASGMPVAMPSRYDEPSQRAFANYPGGTSLERWHRQLLRTAMEQADFSVQAEEWWHFDHASFGAISRRPEQEGPDFDGCGAGRGYGGL